MVTEAFRLAILKYRARGGKCWRLAAEHGMSPSALSAIVTGARRVGYDERIVKIGEALGLKPEEIFDDASDEVAS